MATNDRKSLPPEALALIDDANKALNDARTAAENAESLSMIAEDVGREAEYEARHSLAPGVHEAAKSSQRSAAHAHVDAAAAKRSSHDAEKHASEAIRAAQRGQLDEAREHLESARAAAEEALRRVEQAEVNARAARNSEIEADLRKLAADGPVPHDKDIAHEDLPKERGEMRPVLYLAEFDTPDAIIHAAEAVRDAGYEKWDVHTPYPIHGMDAAMGLNETKIGFISFIAAMTGLVSAVLMIQYMNNWDYPIIVGGKPPGAFPSMVPIMFELTILVCGLATVLGMFHLARLPRHHHPVFYSERFARATDDRFFVSIEVADRKFDVKQTGQLLRGLHPVNVELVEEEAGR